MSFRRASVLTPHVKPEPRYAARLRAIVTETEPLLRKIGEAESAVRPAPGKWSPREIIGHLVDSASINHQRFVRAAFQDDLVFPGYDRSTFTHSVREFLLL